MRQSNLKILVVAAAPEDSRAFIPSLKRKTRHKITCVETVKEALHSLSREAQDAILYDLRTMERAGLSKIAAAHEALSVIDLADVSCQEKAVEALHGGASQYWIVDKKPTPAFWRFVRLVISRKKKENEANRTMSTLSVVNQDLYQFAKEVGESHGKLRKKEVDKTERLATASHQMRTPLSAIQGYVSLLLEGRIGDLNVKQNAFLERVRSSTNRLHRLMNDLLDLAKIESDTVRLVKKWTDPEEWLEQEVTFFKPQAELKALSLNLEIEGTLRRVYCDVDWIQEAVSNLISNAVKYTPDKGKIWVRARMIHKDLEIEVQDTGPGIPAEDLHGVFEPFYTVHKKMHAQAVESTGLGLSLVKKIVEAHGGKVSVRCEPRKGACFTIRLPVHEKAHKHS